MDCRLIIDGTGGPAWNMAVDETLLESVSRDNECVLRFYQWSAPTLSLGYFQRLADRRQHLASQECPMVRRSSGGGAIIHDRELTYSLCLPQSHRLSRDAGQLYRAVHAALVGILSRATGRAIALRGSVAAPHTAEPFLCFRRSAAGDVLLEGHKVAGSAQRRCRGAILQHGSVLLETSAAAPEVPGIASLCGIELPASKLGQEWTPQLEQAIELRCREEGLSVAERLRAAVLESSRFNSDRWNSLR